jgi:hypothetical protein
VTEAVSQPVDAVERGERVIDCRRQRADRHLDELVDGKAEILGERAIGADNVRTVLSRPANPLVPS